MQEPRRTRQQQRVMVEADGDGRPGGIFNLASFGAPRYRVTVLRHNEPPPEPEELEGSELTDAERNAAIARERMRREGRV